MKRIFAEKKKRSFPLGILLTAAFFLLVVVVVIVGVRDMAKGSEEERLSMMTQAVHRSLMQCYAIEGRYPRNISHLEEYYGLILDRENYVYHYEPVADNIMPGIGVYSLKPGD